MLQEQHPADVTGPISDDDLVYAIDLLESTKISLHEAVKGLSAEQLTARPDPERWSVAECLEHIVLVEEGIFGRLQHTMQKPDEPEKRAEIQVSDLYLTKALRSRKTGISSPEPFVPTGRFGNTEATLVAFDEQRNQVIAYAKSAPGNWRTHFFKHLVFGTIDGFQTLLLFAGHGERHRKQIEEIKATSGFPQ
jgi:DinB superfamily